VPKILVSFGPTKGVVSKSMLAMIAPRKQHH
jgi:hypothetical protein